MTYSAKEIFYTLQGEGRNTGRAAVFCRFSGCNLWSGRVEDKQNAICKFCDTDFVGVDGDGGGKFDSAESLASAIDMMWPTSHKGNRFVVCTGGEPLLQVDRELIIALHAKNFTVAVETNGTLPVPEGIDWVCVSPKAGTKIVVTKGNELKVVYPQETDPRTYDHLDFEHFFIQPMDGPFQAQNLDASVAFCLANPKWRLSLQTHKILGVR